MRVSKVGSPGVCQAPIAILGMACRLPGHCNSPRELWDFIMKGKVADLDPPPSRFSLKGHFDGSSKPNTMKTPGGMFMEDVDPTAFDAYFFNISNADASSMDPQQRVLLEVSYECLENAGIPKENLEGMRVGCIVGASAVDYHEMDCRDPEDRTDSPTMGSCRSLLSNRISHFLGIHGPSLTVDTACSSSLTALQMGCTYLRSHEVDVMLICGVNMYLSPERNQDMGAMRSAASATGRCHSFDAKADGYVIAEAANAVVLKRADDAVRHRDPIRAIIRGIAINSAGKTAGIAMPNPKAQEAVIRDAYAFAGIAEPELAETGYIECHGTGTRAGDPAEVQGLSSVFGQSITAGSDQRPLLIGSVKGNIGHSEAAAGLSGVIKAVLALENAVIPPTATFKTANPAIDFQGLGIEVVGRTLPWPVHSKLRAGVNSFGFGGSNAHAIIESPEYCLGKQATDHKSCYFGEEEIEDDFFTKEDHDSSPCSETLPYLLLVSANEEASLEAYVMSLSSLLLNPSVRISINDLAFTLSERRSRLYHRGFAVARSTDLNKNSFTFVKRSPKVPDIAYIFTGQGAQWPLMGKRLLESFPVAMDIVEALDRALGELREPPSFSLVQQLMKNDNVDYLRRPDVSQPLVTALQLAYIEVLSTWGMRPKCVIGHSSGEIAAAAAAGYISNTDAIKIAYLRGQAVVCAMKDEPLSMMAVGLGADKLEHYLDSDDHAVQVACLNSPSSTTVSGTVQALEKLQRKLQQDKCFARLLKVDMAYHSDYVQPAGDLYVRLMLENSVPARKATNRSDSTVTMFSTVSGGQMGAFADAKYWRENMISQVKFDKSLGKLLDSTTSPKALIEVGPSNTLSGPILQILRENPVAGSQDSTYMSVAQRDQDTTTTLFSVAGKFISLGGSLNMSAINRYSKESVLVDLPNYKWNHSTRHWHESLASKDWRHRPFAKHDLLGTKIPGTPWHHPTWKNKMQTKDVSWLLDHQIGNQVVFPAAGYICMAEEAIHQAMIMTVWSDARPEKPTFRMRNTKFHKALVLDPMTSCTLMTSLALVAGSSDVWHEVRVYSMESDVVSLHASGLVRIEDGMVESPAAPEKILPLHHPVTTASWYDSLRSKVGLGFGPSFQKFTAFEYEAGRSENRATVSLVPPDSTWKQSRYIIHPACIDGCFQATTAAIWQSDYGNGGNALVPRQIDSIIMPMALQEPSDDAYAYVVATTNYTGIGRPDVVRNYESFGSMYHPETGAALLTISGLYLVELESNKSPAVSSVFTHLSWAADIQFLSDFGLETIETESQKKCGDDLDKGAKNVVQSLVRMALHKRPGATVVEVNLDANSTSSLILEKCTTPSPGEEIDLDLSKFMYISNHPGAVALVQETYNGIERAQFACSDFSELNVLYSQAYDVVILRLPPQQAQPPDLVRIVNVVMTNCLAKEGLAILMIDKSIPEYDTIVADARIEMIASSKTVTVCRAMEVPVPLPQLDITVVTLQEELNPLTDTLKLQYLGWNLKYADSVSGIRRREKVMVMDALSASALPILHQRGWEKLQYLVDAECDILWVTRGTQMQVESPDGAMVHGLFRTIRSENPRLKLITLDLEHSTGDAARLAINSCLALLFRNLNPSTQDSEFVERKGVIYISRVLPDSELNRTVQEDLTGTRYETVNFDDRSSLVRLQVGQIGQIASLEFHRIAEAPDDLPSGHVEIQVIAAGVNFKDVAKTLGLVPGNEWILGEDGSGVITRVGSGVTKLKPGQRVAFLRTGAFSNIVSVSAKRVCAIPDSMSFVEAATIPCVFLTAVYCLFDLASMKAGDRVLIHSGAGGVGIAAIQLCLSIGATVYTTVGSAEKREFLTSQFGIPSERIFSSRTREFATQIQRQTQGKGVNIVLNSLTGDLLDESWRIVGYGGTMVEIGKRDILSQATLSMEPFIRNASFRGFDLLNLTDDSLIERLFDRVFNLMHAGTVHPIHPIKIFTFSEIPAALREMGSGKHIGKFIISRDRDSPLNITVRAPPRGVKLRSDMSYLIVGGLHGVCGSLAKFMAKNGARHLTVLSRRGDIDVRALRIRDNLNSHGCEVEFVKGDATLEQDVRRAFQSSQLGICGVIQGAMVIRDGAFDTMTLRDFEFPLHCKVQGTWNLHRVSLEQPTSLDFFTMLSSVSGVTGRRGQANYAAANTFLDAFATYRQSLGLPACSIALGAIEHIGYLAEHQTLLKGFQDKVWYGIGERLLQDIFRFSIQQQSPSPLSQVSMAHMITGIQTTQPEDSHLLLDSRFSGLFSHNEFIGDVQSTHESDDVRAIKMSIRSKADAKTTLDLMVSLLNKCLMQILQMSTPLDPTRPLSIYGIDSLVAIEFRDFVRQELSAEIRTLEFLNALSLISISGLIINRLRL